MPSAFVFPGQGSQYLAMGKSLYEDSAPDLYALADRIFASEHPSLPESLSSVVFQGPEDLLKRTLYTQPAILTMSLALARELKSQIRDSVIPRPAYLAGHSLGEFAALYMASVLSLEDTLTLVIRRAALMDKAPAGAMAAIVGMEEARLADFCEQNYLGVANYNSPDQIVITGTEPAVIAAEKAIEQIVASEGLKIRFIRLAVGGPFHSPLMGKASEEFSRLIDALSFADAQIPIIQNVDAKPSLDAEEIRSKLKQQMTSAVQWTQTTRFLLDAAARSEISDVWEIGPGRVLAGLIKKQDRRFPVINIEDFAAIKSQLSSVSI